MKTYTISATLRTGGEMNWREDERDYYTHQEATTYEAPDADEFHTAIAMAKGYDNIATVYIAENDTETGECRIMEECRLTEEA